MAKQIQNLLLIALETTTLAYNVNSAENETVVHEFNSVYNNQFTSDEECANNSLIDIETVEKCIKQLKCNKSAGLDDIVAEHLIHAHPAVVVHLKLLFGVMLTH